MYVLPYHGLVLDHRLEKIIERKAIEPKMGD